MKGVTLNFFALHCLSLLQLLSFRPTQEIGKFCAMTKESMPSATRRRHSLSLHAYIDHSPHPGKMRREQEKEKEKPLQGSERAFHSSLFGVQGKSFPSFCHPALFVQHLGNSSPYLSSLFDVWGRVSPPRLIRSSFFGGAGSPPSVDSSLTFWRPGQEFPLFVSPSPFCAAFGK